MQQKQTKSFPLMYLMSPFPNTSYSPYCLCALPACFPEMFAEGFREGLLTLCISFTKVLCTFAFSLILLLRKLLSAAHTTLRNSTGFIKWFATERC